MIVTARQLQDLQGKRRSRLTPPALVWVRSKRLKIGYGPAEMAESKKANQSETTPAAPPWGASTLLWWCDGPCGVAKAAIAAQARESNLAPIAVPSEATQLTSAIKRLASAVKGDSAGQDRGRGDRLRQSLSIPPSHRGDVPGIGRSGDRRRGRQRARSGISVQKRSADSQHAFAFRARFAESFRGNAAAVAGDGHMRVGKVIGRMTLQKMYATLTGGRFLLVEVQDRFSLAGNARKSVESLVVYDEWGAAEGDLIAFTESREAAMPFYPEKRVPLDAYNAAILDAAVISLEI
jgi:microcompartment protein CcmK/EutM